MCCYWHGIDRCEISEGKFGNAISSNVQCTLRMFLSKGLDVGYNEISTDADAVVSKFILSHEIWHCKRINILTLQITQLGHCWVYIALPEPSSRGTALGVH